MKNMTNRAVFTAVAVFVIVSAAYAVPKVSNVEMTQREGTRIVDISYTLEDEAAIVTLGIETNSVALPDSAVTRLSGDVCKVIQPGANKSIVWNAGEDWPENLTEIARAKVTAWSTNAPPQVMVIDLRGGPNTNYYPMTYHVSTAALPYGGVTNHIYKNTRLVMRKIPNGSFNMGESPCEVTLTNDFYAGVFEVTQGQWKQVMGGNPSGFSTDSDWMYRPVENVTYNDIRGSSDGAGWPGSAKVDATSFMGRLRSKIGFSGFDLPTEAQWEYACRAETISYFNDGVSSSSSDIDILDGLAWYKDNAGGKTHLVGQKKPNEWGLYDMHGNVYEWCLDWYADLLEDGDNPKGAETGDKRVLRSCGWNLYSTAAACRSAARNKDVTSYMKSYVGFRLVRTLP